MTLFGEGPDPVGVVELDDGVGDMVEIIVLNDPDKESEKGHAVLLTTTTSACWQDTRGERRQRVGHHVE